MQKHFFIEQPPISEKYRLLVDDINDNGEFAMTEDLEMVLYNRSILGSELNIDFTIYSAFSEKGITAVLPLGRFITIWQISKDESAQRILFIDYKNKLAKSFRDIGKELMPEYFSENVYREFEKVYATHFSSFNENSDIIELVLPMK